MTTPETTPAATQPAARRASSIARRMWIAGTVLAAIMLAGTGKLVWDIHCDALDEAKAEVRNLGIALGEQATHHLQVLDLLLRSVQVRVDDFDLATPDAFRAAMASTAGVRFLAAQITALPRPHGLAVFDDNGEMIARGRNPTAGRFSIADRPYFKVLRQSGDAPTQVGLLPDSRDSAQPSIFLARRIAAPDGAFLGVAVSTLQLEHLVSFYRAVSQDRPFRVTLLRRDGIILARQPPNAQVSAVMPHESPWYPLVDAGGGTYVSPGFLTGNPSVVSVYPLPDLPLVVNVSISQADVLRSWRTEGLVMGGAGMTLATVILVLFGSLARQVRRQERDSAALRASEARLRDFAAMASDWFWELDADLRLSWVSIASSAPRAQAPSHIDNHRWDLHDSSLDPANWVAHRSDLEARRPFENLRYESSGQDDTTVYRQISGKPVFDEAGVFLGYRGIGKDITAEVLAEHALVDAKDRAVRAEQLLRDAIESMSEGFAIFDAQERLVMCNDAYRNLFPGGEEYVMAGAKMDALLREGARRGMYPSVPAGSTDIPDSTFDGCRALSGTTEQELGDGRWLLVSNRRTSDGGFAGIRVDITRMKRAQAALHASQDSLEQAQEIGGIGSWELDLTTGYFHLSRQLYRMRGIPEGTPVTRESMRPTTHPDDLDALDAWFAAQARGESPGTIEFRVVHDDGTTRTIRSDGRGIPGPDGAIRIISGTSQDVTDRRLIERQLSQAQKMEALGNLTGGMAHDFNNMLGVITGNLDLLRRMVADNPIALEVCDEALGGASRGAEMIRRLLAFARRQSLRPERTDLNELILETTKLLHRTLGSSIMLRTTLSADVWPVMVDMPLLEAALINLANNARDAMPQGGHLEITTRNVVLDETYVASQTEVTPGEYALIEVTDTGAGIPPEIIGRIFEPFFSTKGPQKGTGLGLSMAFGFVKQSGGHLTVYSAPGRGTTFRLYFPRTESGPVATLARPPLAPLPGGKETILLVEDNEQLRAATGRQLRALGYLVLEAENAAMALKVLDAAAHVELLFSDVVMPGGMDGFALVNEAIRRRPGLHILITSGFAGLANDRAASPFRILNKPYREEELATAIRDVLDTASSLH